LISGKGETSSRLPAFSLFLPGSCPNYRDRRIGGRCVLCGELISPSEWEVVDHRIPFCYGGGNEPANLQIAHLYCNRQKGYQVDPMDLLRYLEGRYLNL
jgi:5-methylcytosine-specific restriction endonuclease McrA